MTDDLPEHNDARLQYWDDDVPAFIHRTISKLVSLLLLLLLLFIIIYFLLRLSSYI